MDDGTIKHCSLLVSEGMSKFVSVVPQPLHVFPLYMINYDCYCVPPSQTSQLASKGWFKKNLENHYFFIPYTCLSAKKTRGGLYEIFHNFFVLFSQPFPKLVVCNNLFWLPPTLCPGRREVKFIGNLFIIVRLSSPAGKGREVLLLLSKLKQIVLFVYECLSIPFHENSTS